MPTTTRPTLDECRAGVIQHALSEHAHKILQGWFLAHAAAAHALPPADRKQGRGKSTESVALDSTAVLNPEENAGFKAWFTASFGEALNIRTAYNYMTAAARAGLTLDMSEADALEAARAKLSGVARLSDLYKPEALTTTTPPSGPEDKTAMLKQTWLDFGDHLQALTADESAEQKALLALTPRELKTLEEHTRRALDCIKAAKAAVTRGAAA